MLIAEIVGTRANGVDLLADALQPLLRVRARRVIHIKGVARRVQTFMRRIQRRNIILERLGIIGHVRFAELELLLRLGENALAVLDLMGKPLVIRAIGFQPPAQLRQRHARVGHLRTLLIVCRAFGKDLVLQRPDLGLTILGGRLGILLLVVQRA